MYTFKQNWQKEFFFVMKKLFENKLISFFANYSVDIARKPNTIGYE